MGILFKLFKEFEDRLSNKELYDKFEDSLLRDWMGVSKGRLFYYMRRRHQQPEIYECTGWIKDKIYMDTTVMPLLWALRKIRIYKPERMAYKKAAKFFNVSVDDLELLIEWWDSREYKESDIIDTKSGICHTEERLFTSPLPNLEDFTEQKGNLIKSIAIRVMNKPSFKYIFNIYEEYESILSELCHRGIVHAYYRHYMTDKELKWYLGMNIRGHLTDIARMYSAKKRTSHNFDKETRKFTLTTVSTDAMSPQEKSSLIAVDNGQSNSTLVMDILHIMEKTSPLESREREGVIKFITTVVTSNRIMGTEEIASLVEETGIDPAIFIKYPEIRDRLMAV